MTLHRQNKYGQLVKVEPDDMFIASDGTAHFKFGDKGYTVPKQNQPSYHVGEEVAVAQKYWDLRDCDAFYEALQKADPTFPLECIKGEKGCHNKMFVRADWMPHRIRITDIKMERLQDISGKDAMREGIRQSIIEYGDKKIVQWTYFGEKITTWFDSPRDAFAALIERISGRGTWQRNPWVYAYEFELLK